MGSRPWREVRPQVVTDEARVARCAAEMEAVIAKHQAILDTMPQQEGTPGDHGWLVAEMDDWAPSRHAANELMLGDDEA